jgi:hypothetical protein
MLTRKEMILGAKGVAVVVLTLATVALFLSVVGVG